MPNSEKAIDGTFQVIAKRVAPQGERGKLFITVPNFGACMLRKITAVEKGQLLTGKVSLTLAHYEEDQHGKPLAKGPFDRYEITDYTSDADVNAVERENALAKQINASIAKTNFTGDQLLSLIGKAVPTVVADSLA